MKLYCFFNYLKEIYSFELISRKRGHVYVYEYEQKRHGYLKEHPLILYMVVQTNKDGYAKDANIKMGFYTKAQALDYIYNRYAIKTYDPNNLYERKAGDSI